MAKLSEFFTRPQSYVGEGVNHEEQSFVGTMTITPVVNGKGLRIEFKALGKDGTVYHEESSIIGPGFDGKPCLFVLSNNHPGVTPHVLKREDKKSWVFGFGDVADSNAFREEIALALSEDGSVEYTYSWGMPGGEFKTRSGVKMRAR